jgi:hypothetical protein
MDFRSLAATFTSERFKLTVRAENCGSQKTSQEALAVTYVRRFRPPGGYIIYRESSPCRGLSLRNLPRKLPLPGTFAPEFTAKAALTCLPRRCFAALAARVALPATSARNPGSICAGPTGLLAPTNGFPSAYALGYRVPPLWGWVSLSYAAKNLARPSTGKSGCRKRRGAPRSPRMASAAR